jgi:hypothetical protein
MVNALTVLRTCKLREITLFLQFQREEYDRCEQAVSLVENRLARTSISANAMLHQPT